MAVMRPFSARTVAVLLVLIVLFTTSLYSEMTVASLKALTVRPLARPTAVMSTLPR